MAKVELAIGVAPVVGGDDEINEYADKVWQEFQLTTLVKELLGKRKVVQRKIDAARKRLKRVGKRLNVLESDWVVNPA